MKVLNQLVRHFWDRGALSEDQAHYLVEHGFIRAEELENYSAREESPEDIRAYTPDPVVVLPPDTWDEQAEQLDESRPRAKKVGGKAGAKTPDFDRAQLQSALAAELKNRARFTPALVELASRTVDSWEDAALALRQATPERLRDLLVRATSTRPAIVGELWACLRGEPFHEIVGTDDARGPVARAYNLLLRATTPAELRQVGWLLRLPEACVVSNLVQVRRNFLAALAWMYEHRRVKLGRCVQRPSRSLPGWDTLAFGFVLLHNARGHASRRKPTGYVLSREADDVKLRDAWTIAMSLDRVATTPFFTRMFAKARTGDESPDAFHLYCPNDWKV
jgi:hypothetical protein